MSLVEHSPGCYSKQSSKYIQASIQAGHLWSDVTRHYLLKILCAGSVTSCSPQGQGGGSRMLPNPGITPAAHVQCSTAVPQVGKASVPRVPFPPGVTGHRDALTVKARALGPVEPKLSGQPEILKSPQPSSHVCAHSCTPLALSPPSVLPQCLKPFSPAHTQTQGSAPSPPVCTGPVSHRALLCHKALFRLHTCSPYTTTVLIKLQAQAGSNWSNWHLGLSEGPWSVFPLATHRVLTCLRDHWQITFLWSALTSHFERIYC